MRNLTITRRKSFVGCAMKDKVYIRDALAQELTINGVPCRKIGEIKNGETKTFQIEDGEQQVFLIADKVSKDYCNAAITIPERQEDISLSGTHKFVFGSNPFRFDGERGIFSSMCRGQLIPLLLGGEAVSLSPRIRRTACAHRTVDCHSCRFLCHCRRWRWTLYHRGIARHDRG